MANYSLLVHESLMAYESFVASFVEEKYDILLRTAQKFPGLRPGVQNAGKIGYSAP